MFDGSFYTSEEQQFVFVTLISLDGNIKIENQMLWITNTPYVLSHDAEIPIHCAIGKNLSYIFHSEKPLCIASHAPVDTYSNRFGTIVNAVSHNSSKN